MCADGVPHIFGKILTRATTFIRLHFNQRSAQKVMGLQNCRSSNFKNYVTLDLGVPRQNDI